MRHALSAKRLLGALRVAAVSAPGARRPMVTSNRSQIESNLVRRDKAPYAKRQAYLHVILQRLELLEHLELLELRSI